MRVFAIGDLHLPGGDDKPMDVFGERWEGHFEKISRDWKQKVTDEDVVLIPGDISWAMQLENALPDLASVAALPGSKILLRGNHDYWWSSLTRVRESLPDGMYALQNDALRLGDCVFCGSRGWTGEETAEDRKIYTRELIRLELSLQNAVSLGGRMIALCHYPPVNEKGDASKVSALLEKYGAEYAVYGHLHGAHVNAFNGESRGVRYACVSCDQTDFCLTELEL